MTTSAQPVAADFSQRHIAQFCVLLADVMDTFLASHPTPTLTPEILPDSDLARDWNTIGYLVADREADELHPDDRHTVFFGVLAKSKQVNGPYAVILRGTMGWREWADNCKIAKTQFPHPGTCTPGALVCFPDARCGSVEEGFFGIYQSMRYMPISGGPSVVAWQGIHEAIHDPDAQLYVVGHSMGAALATYLTFDLAQHAPRQAVGVFIASPKPGNGDFAKAFDAAVADYAVYEYVRDIVPDLPPSLLGYKTLPRLIQLTVPTVQATIKDEVRSNHHALCYAAMMDYHLKTPEQWKALLVRDDCEPDCIEGPGYALQLAA